MPRMDILNTVEREAFNSPPVFSSFQRKQYFDFPSKLGRFAAGLRNPAYQLGFLLSAGYFKAARRVSALGLQRVLGLGSYRSAWLMLHKLRQAMVRPGREKLSGVIEVDETYWGGAEFGGATGRKTLSKVLIIVAAEADGKRIGRIRMALIEDFDRKTLHRFIQDNIELGSTVCTDGLNSYRELDGYIHNRKVQNLRQGGEPLLPRVHLVISLLKRWLLGTLQGSPSDKYLDDYP